jgi:creatinine amidohydrolase/Fe(II)-dependent formamide hydrolase-like protein
MTLLASVSRLTAATLLALVLASTPAGPSSATLTAQPTVDLEQLTSPEVAARIKAGATTILIPIGGTEQNGPYMALGKHNRRAHLLAARIAGKLGNALIAPVIAYVPEGAVSPPSEHMKFAGTLSIPSPAFEATLAGAAESLRAHGFRDIVFLTEHGGYRAAVARVAALLNQRWAAATVAARAHALPEYYRAATTGFEQILAQHGVQAAEAGAHAGLADTALMLALDPSLVRADALPSAPAPTPAQGVHGDPRRATAALGQLGVDLIVDTSVAAIRAAVKRD